MRSASIRCILDDHLTALKHWRVWSSLSLSTLRMRYRRSTLGPFWLTLRETIFIVVLGVLFAKIQGANFKTFFPFFAAGKTMWVFLSGFFLKSRIVFLSVKRQIYLTRRGYMAHVFKYLFDEVITFIHILPPLLVVLIYCDNFSLNIFYLFPGLLLTLIFGYAVSVICGCLSLRFWDFDLAISSAIPPMMFITPIIFPVENLGEYQWTALLNPLYYMIEICRAPLLGSSPPDYIWFGAILIDAILVLMALVVFKRSRNKLAYWAD